jgi:hypothetical protein
MTLHGSYGQLINQRRAYSFIEETCQDLLSILFRFFFFLLAYDGEVNDE